VPYKRIVVGTDGSEQARSALAVAARLAKASRATLLIVHASSRDAQGREILRAAAAGAQEVAARVGTEMRPGPGADVLVEVADQQDADLIVVGSRGLSRAKQVLIGSVSHRVAYRAPCDVLIVRAEHGPEDVPYRRILLGTDGSATADRCARKGYDLAGLLGASITLTFVGHPRTAQIVLDDTHDCQDVKVEVTKRSVEGRAADQIVRLAEQDGLDLIVVGNRGMRGPARLLLGSVPQDVIQHAPCDVLIARTTTQVLSEVAPGEGGIIRRDGRKIAVYRDGAGELWAVSAKCTHLGCTVQWNGAEKTWDCPCHGSRFSVTGEVINGPASQPLARTDV
jgi:nucleotide-binding universal stress UspA family protein/nitrite reductase/ring-hydroxylating ferredoxin subunit